ncbi:lytic transglycosylase domain-containing protein (plasmid) [Burkholderia sp. MS455]|uniref:lytic transglycosylase domain-containing protein n=1 Tax=Burkholderia sp. MS455 TaxID=2811788 RepID=UPI0019589EEB|nr:lytic transglycosylase domain-containing protein [Burkholderia sp. MS455]QRR11780.1 lytic transglycosylase domain-containing protein [Burkholderia sp. MS455]
MAGYIVCDLGRYRVFLVSVVVLNSLLFVTNTRADCIDDAAAYHHINPSLARAIAAVESSFSPVAYHRNSNGSEDIGLMQINSSWLPTLSRFGISRASLFDACVNAYVGAWILSQNISRLGLTWDAVGAYNAASPRKRVQYARRVYAELLRFVSGSPATRSVASVASTAVPTAVDTARRLGPEAE